MNRTLAAAGLVIALASSAGAAAQTISFSQRTLNLDGRDVTVEVGMLEVPADHGSPGGGRFDLAVARLRSTAARPEPPIVYLAGGPGGSGIAAVRIPYMLELFEKLRAHADVILLDQRGTGMSKPAPVCTAPESPPTDVFASGEKLSGYYAQRVRACVAEWQASGVDTRLFTTEQSADDLELLRRGLAVDRIQLLGFSYGTHLGLAALRRHGTGIARAVLAGVEGPDHNWKLPSTMERQLDRLSALAAADSAYHERLPDLKRALSDVLNRAQSEPLEVRTADARQQPVELSIGADGLRYLIARDLGDTNDLPNYPAWIWTMTQGIDLGLRNYAPRRWNELRTIALMGVATDCASGVSAARKARVLAEAPGTVLRDAGNMWFEQRCAALPVQVLSDDFRQPVRSAVPTLFISGDLDSQTPPSNVEEIRRGFKNAAHIVVQNAGHESTLPDARVQAAIVRFFAGGAVRDSTIALPALRFRPPPTLAARDR